MTRIMCLSIVTTAIAALTVGAIYINHKRINYTCVGAYRTDINLPGVHLTGVINIVNSVSRAQRIYSNMEGSVDLNGKKYHLSREIAWRYEMTNSQAGLMRITQLYETVSSSDTIKGTQVDSYVIGKEKSGRIIRQWKLNDDVVLVGNPYSPIYSCVLVK